MQLADINSVLILHDKPDDVRDWLERQFPDIRFACARAPSEVGPATTAMNPEAVFSLSHALFPGASHRPAFEHASVRWIHVGGSGYDHLLPWTRSKVRVTTCQGVLAPYLAETVIGGILALNGNFLLYTDQQRRNTWRPHPFRPLAGQTLLVVGLGAIGTLVAQNAKALGMLGLAIRRKPSPCQAVDELHAPEALLEILGQADFVTLHVRLSAETRGMINSGALQACKPGAKLINTSRGAVIDEAALIAALETGHLSGAYLDVFETEPLPATSPLWSLPNVLITPHTSDNVADWPQRFAVVFAENLKRWREGQPLINE